MARTCIYLTLLLIGLVSTGCSMSVEMMGLSSKVTNQFKLTSQHSDHANVSTWMVQLKDHLKSGKVPTEDDFVVVNGAITSITEVSTGVFDITVIPQADGLTSVELKKEFTNSDNTSSGEVISVMIDRQIPTISLAHSEGAMTDMRSVSVTLTASEVVTGISSAAFQVTNGQVQSITGSGDTYTVVIRADAEGPVDVVFSSDEATDLAGNKNSVASNVVDWIYNAAVPVISLGSCDAYKTSAPVSLSFTASEDVVDFTATDITVTGATLSNFTKIDDANYTAQLTAISEGAVSVSIAVGVYEDIYGLVNDTATDCDFTFDSVAPTVTLSSLPAHTAVSPQVVTVTLSEPVQKFDLTVLTLNNATAVVTGSGVNYSIELFPIIEGPYSVAVASGAVEDVAGNGNATTVSTTGRYDITPPVGILSAETGSFSFGTPVLFLLSYNEEVTGVISGANFNISGGSIIGLIGTAGSKNYVIRVMPWGPGILSLSLKGNVATNLAGLTQVNPISAETTYYDDSAVIVQFDQGETYITETNNAPQSLLVTMKTAAGALATKPYEVEVFFSVVGDAQPGVDYSLTTTSVKIPAGVSTATIPYQVLQNAAQDKNKFFQVNLYYANSPAVQMGRVYQSRVLINDVQGASSRRTIASYHANSSRKCIIDNTQALRCWGVNDGGQVGDGTTINRDTPVEVDPGVSYKYVAHGVNISCGITVAGKLRCWGRRHYVGRATMPTDAEAYLPADVHSTETYTDVAIGGVRACAITSSGEVDCWKASETPTRVVGTSLPEKFVKLVLGGADNACAISELKNVYCWGTSNNWGTTAIPASETPTLIYTDILKFSISAYTDAGCYIKTDHKLYCWSNGVRFGIGGQGPTAPVSGNAAEVSGGRLYDDVSLGNRHACAVRQSPLGAIDCWGEKGDRGSNSLGLGDNLDYRVHVPTQVASNLVFTNVVASDASTCAMTNDSKLVCWGETSGDGGLNFSLLPKAADLRETYVSVKAGRGFACGILADGKLKCWGSRHHNDYIVASIGDGTGHSRSSPVVIDRGREYLKISTEGSSICGIRDNKGLYCWGNATNAIITHQGEGAGFKRVFLPTRVGNDEFLDISIGPAVNNDYSHIAAAIRGDGKMLWWGVFPGSPGIVWTPEVVVDNGQKYKQVATGGNHVCGLTEEGAVRCWGNNGQRALGIKVSGVTPAPPSSTTTPLPIENPTGVIFTQVGVGENFSCALSADQEIYCWGSAENNRNGAPSMQETMRKLVSLTGGVADKFSKIAIGAKGGCGLVTSGVVKCWGTHAEGLLGNNTSSGTTVNPAPIHDSDLYKDISMGAFFTCGVTQAGKLKCWGSNSTSALGDDSVHRSTAAPVDITNWIFP